MKNSLFNIIEIFQGCIIRIPAFQRGYSWEVKQLNELWKDILNLEPKYDSKFHFTGILVFEELNELPNNWIKEIPQKKLQESNLKPLSLVDGQQRLTTIIILLYVLIQEMHQHTLEKYLGIDDKFTLLTKFLRIRNDDSNLYLFGYEIDTPSHQYLLNRIFEDESVELKEPETVYTQNLEFAKTYFIERLKDFPTSETRYRILHIIMHQLKFSRLLLKPNEIDISMVFETLNFRGKPLSHLELLKNRLLYLLSQNKDRIQNWKSLKNQVISTWLTVYEYLGKIDKRWINEDEFLRSYWLIFFNHENRVKGEFNDFVEDIFDKRYPIKSSSNDNLTFKNLKSFLTNLRKSIKAMFFIHNPELISDYTEEQFTEISKIKDERIIVLLQRLNELRTGWQAAKNIICAYIISENYDTDQLSDVASLLERHNFLLYYLFGKKSDTNRVYLFRATNKVFTRKHHLNTVIQIKNLTDSETRDHNAISNFIHRAKAQNNRFYDWMGIDYLLREYERYLISGKDLYYYESLHKYKKFLMFNPNIRNYGFDDFKAGTLKYNYGYSVGNIYLSPQNRQNEDYKTICEKIKSNGSQIEKEVLGKKYNTNLIYNRGIKILKFIQLRWNKELPLNSENEIKKILLDAIPQSLKKDDQQVTSDDHSIG